MTGNVAQKDLVVLVADKNMEFAVKGLLGRPEALGIRKINHDILVHPLRDPGCFLQGPEFLRPFVNVYSRSIVMLDKEGSGRELDGREDLESDIEGRLSRSGWNDRAAAIVIEPELEAWVWSDSPHVGLALGWEGRRPKLRSWLKERGLITGGEAKPYKPKEALELVLMTACKPRSASIYFQLSQSVSFTNCEDEAFKKLRTKLQQWFQ